MSPLLEITGQNNQMQNLRERERACKNILVHGGIYAHLVQYDPVCICNLFYCLIHHPSWFHFIQMLHSMLTVHQSNNAIKLHIPCDHVICTECFNDRSRLCKAYKEAQQDVCNNTILMHSKADVLNCSVTV